MAETKDAQKPPVKRETPVRSFKKNNFLTHQVKPITADNSNTTTARMFSIEAAHKENVPKIMKPLGSSLKINQNESKEKEVSTITTGINLVQYLTMKTTDKVMFEKLKSEFIEGVKELFDLDLEEEPLMQEMVNYEQFQ